MTATPLSPLPPGTGVALRLHLEEAATAMDATLRQAAGSASIGRHGSTAAGFYLPTGALLLGGRESHPLLAESAAEALATWWVGTNPPTDPIASGELYLTNDPDCDAAGVEDLVLATPDRAGGVPGGICGADGQPSRPGASHPGPRGSPAARGIGPPLVAGGPSRPRESGNRLPARGQRRRSGGISRGLGGPTPRPRPRPQRAGGRPGPLWRRLSPAAWPRWPPQVPGARCSRSWENWNTMRSSGGRRPSRPASVGTARLSPCGWKARTPAGASRPRWPGRPSGRPSARPRQRSRRPSRSWGAWPRPCPSRHRWEPSWLVAPRARRVSSGHRRSPTRSGPPLPAHSPI